MKYKTEIEEKRIRIIQERIKLIILKNGISQKNFGLLIGLSQPRVSDICNGKKEMSVVDYVRVYDMIRWRYSISPEDWFQFENNDFLKTRQAVWKK